MTLQDIYTKFEICKTWEERYRLLIQLSKQLERPSDDELAQWQEIEGCESRLWFEFQSSPRSIKTYSDARLMQGLLFIVKTALFEKTDEELKKFNIQALFDELQITRHLTTTRLNGLQQIQNVVIQSLDHF